MQFSKALLCLLASASSAAAFAPARECRFRYLESKVILPRNRNFVESLSLYLRNLLLLIFSLR